jgi:hypothetical protein
MLERILVDQAIEMLFQLAGDFGRSTRARTVHQTPGALVGKAMHPFPQGRIGKLECVGDVLDVLAFHDLTYRLCTTEDTRFFGLFQERVQGGERIIRKVPFEGPHVGGLHDKVRQKFQHARHTLCLPSLSAQSLSDSNFPEAAN